MEQWDIVSGVGITALGVAASRAVESSRADRLIDDPYAAAFVRAANLPLPLSLVWPDDAAAVSDQDAVVIHGSVYTGLRSRFFDDFLLAAAADGIAQVVIVAAGLDTRAYRLDWPAGLRIFEIDQPKVLDFKDSVLREGGANPSCDRRVVGVDLRADWPGALLTAGYLPDRPAAWLVEGLLPYLPAAAEEHLFQTITALSAPGSRLSVEHVVDLTGMLARGAYDSIREHTNVDMTSLMNSEPRPDALHWLRHHGWDASQEPATSAAERYDRVLSDPRLSTRGTLRLAEDIAFLTASRTG
jgi:methyltransferase (TIGR00027 family)